MTVSAPEYFGDGFVCLSADSATPTARQIALVPGAEVPVLMLDLPAGLRGQAREQVARRQLLDRVGLDAARIEMRPIFAPRQGDKWTKVLVADAGDLAGWKHAAGPNCRALLPDYLALPTAPDVWTITQHDGTLIVRLDPDDGFSAIPDVALTLLGKRLQIEDSAPKAILCSKDVVPTLNALVQDHDIPLVTTPQALKKLGLAQPKVLSHGELEFDLRRDPQVARRQLRKSVLPWRWPVLFGIIAAGLWAATQVIETRRIHDQTAALNQQTRALVQEHFVPSGPLLDIRVQVAQALTQMRAATGDAGTQLGAFDLFAQSADIFMDAGAIIEQVSAISASEMAVTLKLQDFAAVDRLAETLRAAGIATEVVETRASEGSTLVRSEMRLSQAPVESEANQ